MTYDMTKVPAGFQDLIPNNEQTQNTEENVQPLNDNAQPNVFNAQKQPDIMQTNVGSQQDDFYLSVFGGARMQTEDYAETQKYNETEAPIVADKVKKGNIYRKYFATQPEVLAQAKEMAGRLQIPVEAITRSSEDYDAAVKMDNRYKKLLSISPTGEKQFTLDELYAEYPELLKLKTDTDGAIALHNVENVKAVKGILDAGKKGVDSRLIQREINSIGRKAYEGNTLTDTDIQRLKDLRLAQMEMVRHAPEFLEDPFKAISYGTMEQGTMMAEQGLKANLVAIPAAAIVGGGTAIVTKNPAMAGAAFKSAYGSMMKLGYGVEMFKDTVGNYYLDYKEYTDKDGKQLLTDNEARLAATLAAAGEAYLEVANWDTVIGMLKGSAVEGEAKEVLAGIVASAADKASFKAQLAYYMKNRFGKAVAAGASEIKEEGTQSVYTDLVHNAFAFYKPNGDLKKISAEEMAANAWDNMWGAVPSVMGMTGAGHIASSSKYVNKIADWLTSKHEDVLTAQKTAGGINMVEQLLEDARNSELAKNSRDVYDQLVTNSLEGTQYENVIVDTELLLKEDKDGEGNEIFYQLASAAGKNQEQADELKGSQLKIRVADYLKVVEDEKVRDKLRTLISFDERDNCFKRIQENAKEFRKEFDKKVDEQYQRVADRIENWVGANIKGEQEQAIMTQVLFEFMDPKEGVKEIRKQYQARVDEYIQPIVEQMRSGMKQGVTLFMTDDDGNVIANGQGVDVHIGGATRISNNDAWYSNYFKANKKAPSEKEMKQIARDALLGNNPYGVITGLEGADAADLIEAEEQMRSMFDNYDSVMASLDNLDKVVENLDTSELNAMDGLTKEGVEAYKAAKDFLLKANDNVRKSAAASAILVAHHADVWAGYMRQMGHDVTAMDYVTKRLGWGDGNIGAGGLNQQQVINPVIQKQMQAVREKYEGTDQWMKAPDGTETKLTEEQWLYAHTDAFKEKYGDWESLAENTFKGNDISTTVVEERIKQIRHDKFYNDESGTFATFSKKGTTKIICGVAVRLSTENGYTYNDHMTAVYNTPQLFKTAIMSKEKPDINQQMQGTRLYSSYCIINNKPAVAVFTVKVTNNAGEKLYTVQLVELKNPAGNLPENEKTHLPATAGSSTEIISQVDDLSNSTTEKVYKRSSHSEELEEVPVAKLAQKYKSIPNKINEHGEPDFNKLGIQEEYFQRAASPEKTLVAYHNITGQELMRALDFGGFPVPSLAVMKKDVAYDKYGEITLVGTKDMVDPSRGVPVYAKDGYTITFPKPSYAVPKIAAVRKFKDKWKDFFYSIDDAYAIDRLTDDYKYPERMAENLRNSFGFQYYYLTKVLGKNIDVPVNEYVPRLPILKNEAYFKKLYDIVDNADKYDDFHAWEKDIDNVVKEYYDERIGKVKLEGVKNKLIEDRDKILGDGPENQDFFNKLFGELKAYNVAKKHPGKDYGALKTKVRTEYSNIIYGKEYNKWADEQIKELLGEGKVKIGNKLYPFTLENVTKYMVKNAGAATEASFNFSAGKVTALTAQKFKNIGEIHKAEGKLGSEDEFNKSADKAKEIGDKYRGEIGKYGKHSSDSLFDLFDEAMESLAKASDSKGYTTVAKLRAVLKKTDAFRDDIPDDVLQLGVDYLKALTDTTTQYFEAKPQRAIDISEFAGAVVPSDADPALVQRLQDAGLQVEVYPAKDNAARQVATQRIQNGRDDVLFQSAGQKARTANLPMLENAINAYNAGKTMGVIYDVTGWYLGMDGKWRFEIPDNLNKVDISKLPEVASGKSVKLADIYDNPILYEAYPWLKDIPVHVDKLGRSGYLGFTDGKSITMSDELIKEGRVEALEIGDKVYTYSDEQWLDQEGKPVSGVVLDVITEVRKLMDDYSIDAEQAIYAAWQTAKQSLAARESNLEHLPYSDVPDYLKEKAEANLKKALAEAKAKHDLLTDMHNSDKKSYAVKHDYSSEKNRNDFGSTLVHEIQHIIQAYEKFASGGNKNSVQSQIDWEIRKTEKAIHDISENGIELLRKKEAILQNTTDVVQFTNALAEYNKLKRESGITDDEERRLAKLDTALSRLLSQKDTKLNDFIKYMNLHGEQEARLASKKAKMYTSIEDGKQQYGTPYRDLYNSWAENVGEDVKVKGERLLELEEQLLVNDRETTEAELNEYDTLVSDPDLKDLAKAFEDKNMFDWDYEQLQDDYTDTVLNGINKFNAIIVFGGEAVAGAALNQQAARIQGATEITATGKHIIHIMETADQSTFMHEMAHVFYDDLHDLAVDENAPEQVKKDWQNLEKWTAWKEGQLEEYKGTATYDEFKALDAAIRTAQETGKAMYNGQECSLQSLLNRWAQERFARGFEEYLHSGKAPTKPLRNAFSRFRKWLTDIYRAVTGAGAKPSEQVRKIMDRMLATQDEIDSAMEEAQLDALEKKGLFKYLNGTSQDMWEKNLEEIKEDVAAKVMKIAMKDMTDKAKADRAEMLKAEREAAYERISQEPVFVAYQYLKQNPNLNTSDVIETMTDMSLEEYATELKARGGSLDAAVDQYMKDYEAELKGPSRKEIKAAAEQAIADSHYTKVAMVFEIQALEKFVLDEESLVRKLKGIKDEEKAERESAPKAERLINYVQKKQGKEHRIYRDALEGYIQKIQKYAEQKIAGMAIKEATNPAMWKKLAADNADDSINSFAKVEYGMATKQRRVAFFYHTMAELAEKNRKEVDSKVKTLMAHTRTMMREKNMPANDRYLYNHLMYCFGLSNKDALKPPGYPEKFEDVLLTYDENLELSYVDQDGKIDLPDWLTSAMAAESGSFRREYNELRMDQLQLLYNVMENIYKAGRDAKKLKTTRDAQGNILTVDEVVGEIVANAAREIPEREVTDATGMESESWKEAAYRRANEAYVNLLKPETILRQLGNSAIKYIYNPIKIAADNEMVETEHLAEKIRGITDAYHDSLVEMYRNQGVNNPEAEANKAMKELRSKKQYKIGTSNLTKENLIAVALNWGTDINRKRVLEGFNVSQGQVEKALANLNSADWQMIINIWNLFDDYWPRLVEVEANCSGVVLEKQEAVPFTIMDNNGFAYNLNGGYYPIKYDRHKNMRIGDHASDEAKRMSMSGMSRLGMGLGNTKDRMETVKYKLRLDFGVFQEALGDTVHNICMREAVRDVNKVIRDQNFSEFMQATYGQATTKMLENWILDCWAKEPRQKDPWEQAAQWIRSKQTMATLGFRTSTALLNFCNISYVIDYLGATRTMAALKNFYAHPSEQFEFALDKSVFLRERAETMDRDMGSILKQNREKFGEEWYDKIENQAFWLISRTDLMLACPMWLSEYQRVYQESMDKHLSPEHAEREAVLAGDAAVRRVFGSGQIQDLAGVQKGSEFTKIFTMYYSFFSVVHNALMMKAFETRQAWRKSAKSILNEDGSVKATERDYRAAAKALVPIAEGFIFWMLIPAAMEACIRASYGDDKDKEAKNLVKKTLTTMAGTAVGGIPMLREFVPSALEAAFGGRYYGMGGVPIAEEFDQLYKVISTAQSRKKSKLDVLRESLRALTPVTGLPTTMTDAMVSVMQFMDHGKLTKDDILHYIWAITFDKNPDAKKKK